MKSIVQEASTIAKAIEQGWQKAGSPAHFTVKILEMPEKNFFGFTKRSAKIALYFEDAPKQTEHARDKSGYTKPKYNRDHQSREHASRDRERYEQSDRQERHERAERHERPERHEREHRETRDARPQKKYEPLWNEQMVHTVQNWFKNSLYAMNMSDVQFVVEPQQFHLKIVLSKPLLDNPEKEKQLLANFSALILETLRKEYKMGFRGHKIVLSHGS